MRFVPTAALLMAALSAPAAQACYTVYDAANRVLYQSMVAPVDMSRPLHETLPQRFPGGFLVFEEGAACPVVPTVAMGQGGIASRNTAPLLTDERTARSRELPHRSLGQGVALVPPGRVEITPSVTVVPHGRVQAGRGRSAGGTEITELRDGGLIERSPATVLGGPAR